MTSEEGELGLLDTIQCDNNQFNADLLKPELVAALKELERRNRNIGAVGRRTEDWVAYRGEFRLRAETRTYLHYLALRKNHVVLDAGAGFGRLAVAVAPRVSQLLCVDFAEKPLEVLQTGARERGIDNIEIIACDVSSLPRPLGPFDSIYCVETLEQIASHRERLNAMKNFYELLKPGGKCLVAVYPWNSRTREGMNDKEGFYGAGERRLYRYRFTPPELTALFREAGFRNVEMRPLIAVPTSITARLPASLAWIETCCSFIRPLVRFSWLLFGIGIR
jgi:SAM-dependent methyltransferase